ncbi:uncharacterized protein LOC62_02G003288 [Vanrija pseudolonga]|uniref:Uncharacterized protein n=1 Tax=Vanrija pseudolonga TaxID=143232 RepID=A0AAF0Y5K4_9TREE|nr:hypothetical protein LOC62_02G003288 [Vanrija pseudolonga]
MAPSAQYQPLATDDRDGASSPTSYPPSPATAPRSSRRKRVSAAQVARYVLLGALALLGVHSIYVFSARQYAQRFGASGLAAPPPGLNMSSVAGGLVRDATPLRTVSAFFQLAQQEVAARGLDTDNDKLGKSLVDAYVRARVPYCGAEVHPVQENNSTHTHWAPGGLISAHNTVPAAAAACFPLHHDEFAKWWPYPHAPCISTNLRAVAGAGRAFVAPGCDLSAQGQALLQDMGDERFLGKDIEVVPVGSERARCKSRIEHTLMVVGRQDQWNPFHVAEDLITTVVVMLASAAALPDLIDRRLQLVFNDKFGMDGNHFTPLWDRVGAWAPRRLSLDPWIEGECSVTNTIHSVGAGASLLSAMGVDNEFRAASTITWAASHYYRHLFGLSARSLQPKPAPAARRPLNVLWISRAKLDAVAEAQNDMSTWRGVRVLKNEGEVLERIRRGFSEMCGGAASWCAFHDVRDEPEGWGVDGAVAGGPTPVRFAAIDPTVHALETQIHYAGHATIMVGQHGGALGLGLFLPPGDAAIMELQVDEARANHHFEHLAYETGQRYEMVEIQVKVDAERLWERIKAMVETMAK